MAPTAPLPSSSRSLKSSLRERHAARPCVQPSVRGGSGAAVRRASLAATPTQAPGAARSPVAARSAAVADPSVSGKRAAPPEGPATRLRAVVCGSGVAGLAAARVLSDHFDEVFLLERDAPLLDGLEGPGAAGAAADGGQAEVAPVLPGLADASREVLARRRGVPQFQQPHVMLNRGLQELEALFPGLRAELNAGGAVEVPTPRDWVIFDGRMGGELQHKYTAFTMLSATRSLVETELRLRLRKDCPNVKMFSGALVEGLHVDGGRVAGVRLKGSGSPLGADLVVDATGRGSKTPEWLEAAGWAPPPSVTVDANLVYTTAVYELSPEYTGPNSVMCYTAPPNTRTALLLPIEGGRHHMILTGRGEERCEASDDAIWRFVTGLEHPGMANAMRGAKRLGDIRIYERTANFRRKYEDINVPGGLVVLGDGVCAFNPIYGQGMSVAVLESVALGKAIAAALPPKAPTGDGAARLAAARAALPGATASFMKGVGAIVDVPWALATGNDAPFVPGFKQTRMEAAIAGLFEEIGKLSQRDEDVHNTLLRIMHMMEPPSAMLSPVILFKLAVDKGRTFITGGRPQQPPQQLPSA